MEQNELYKLVKDFREGRRYRILGYRVLNDDEKYDIANYIEDNINEYLMMKSILILIQLYLML